MYYVCDSVNLTAVHNFLFYEQLVCTWQKFLFLIHIFHATVLSIIFFYLVCPLTLTNLFVPSEKQLCPVLIFNMSLCLEGQI